MSASLLDLVGLGCIFALYFSSVALKGSLCLCKKVTTTTATMIELTIVNREFVGVDHLKWTWMVGLPLVPKVNSMS